jgi:hypothetical protein
LDKYCIHTGLPKLQKWAKKGLGPLGVKQGAPAPFVSKQKKEKKRKHPFLFH